MKIGKALVLGDAMIPGELFSPAFDLHLAGHVETVHIADWETDWSQLQYRRLEVEKHGPEIESVPDGVAEASDAEILLGLFIPVSTAMLDALPDLRIIGVCRAGLENVNLEEATARGIVVFNVQGRNAEAVSDFAVGLMLAEARNIARAHHAIQKGEWRKSFHNDQAIPQLRNKTVGIIGFGHIGRLVAQKLSGFGVSIVVYDPFVAPEVVEASGARAVSKEELLTASDFVTIHARLSEDTKGMIGAAELSSMKPTSYLINTGRSGLVDQDALEDVLAAGGIAGAGLDVFPTEPLPADSRLRQLDNVTLTTHIAGTTTEVLTNSPFLLMEDVQRLLEDDEPRFVVNPEVLQRTSFASWLEQIRSG
jgi:D-3-phosphoglycerate dehydrogenase / 2-oxoglutarate reductase